MKGIILAGGTGSRLHPLTKVTNKHLLPVYNKPMIYYPIFALRKAGIKDVMIVSGKGHAGDFLELLGSGSHFGMKISYEVQEEAGGIAQALGLAENFSNKEKIIVLLADNIFEDDLTTAVENFKVQKSGAKIMIKSVSDPRAYGVAEMENGKISKIVEKPLNPISDLAVTGCYMYDSSVFDIVKTLKPSGRGELEITDVNNYYLERGDLTFDILKGFWGDCGESFDSLMEAARLVQGSHLALINENYLRIERDHSGISEQSVIHKIEA
ncbi:spore coat protein [Candidatus Peregrinibacteria bacterium CG10_big_fil_rev_8_21_14_0_10_36_19]|nr:MAG: spore coat protein [Candidatus Peregrinibacteria bacterium CG10_big_fil_rev_8_21_14_0_10_36_19]